MRALFHTFALLFLLALLTTAPAPAQAVSAPLPNAPSVADKAVDAGPCVVAPGKTPAPATMRVRGACLVDTTFGIPELIVPAFSAAGHMAFPHDRYPREWTDGAGAFGRLYGDHVARETAGGVTQFLVAAIDREDPRYYASPSPKFTNRAFHAIWFSVIDKNVSGHNTLAVSNIAGGTAAGFVGMAYLPDGYNDVTHAYQRSAVEFATFGAQNLVYEFYPELVHFAHNSTSLSPNPDPTPPSAQNRSLALAFLAVIPGGNLLLPHSCEPRTAFHTHTKNGWSPSPCSLIPTPCLYNPQQGRERPPMPIHIAIPEPTSPLYVEDSAPYNQRSLPQYLHALISAGAIPIPIPLHESPQRVAKILSTCQGILLPGSGADIDPQKYGEQPIPQCESPDPARAAVDELLIQDAFNLHKPILGICYGTQAINVWCGGTLYQDLSAQTASKVDHAPGRTVLEAHPVQVTPNTRLAALLPRQVLPEYVNSSHHQAIHTPGDNLIVSAISPRDNVIEAVELASTGPNAHFVLAVQWHPERTYDSSQFSRNIFHAFLEAAQSWQPRRIEESVLQA